jgi:hypothetical protein
MTDAAAAPAPKKEKAYRMMTERQRREACELFARGERTLEQLAKKYGVTVSAIQKLFSKRGIKKGMKIEETAAKVAQALDRKTVDEVNETVERTKKTREDTYKLASAIASLVGQTIHKAREDGRSMSTTTGEMRALRFAAETVKLTGEIRFNALGIDPLENGDIADLPELRVSELTAEDIAQRRRDLEALAKEEDGLDIDPGSVPDMDDEDDEPMEAEGEPQPDADAGSTLADALEGIETPPAVNETRMTIRLHNGTRIELKGADKPDTLRGVGIHFLIIDEARTSRRHLVQGAAPDARLDRRPRDHHRHAEGLQLALRPLHAGPARRRLPTRRALAHQHLEELAVPDHHLALHSARGNRGGARRHGREVVPPGVRGELRDHVGPRLLRLRPQDHVGDYPFNPRLPIWVGQDFNIDPMSSVIMQPQPNGEVWIVDEIVLPAPTRGDRDELERRYFRWQPTRSRSTPTRPAPIARPRGESDLDILRERGFKRIKYKPQAPAGRRPRQRGEPHVQGRRRLDPDAGQHRPEVQADHRGARADDLQAGHPRGRQGRQGGRAPADAIGYCIEFEFPVRKIDILGVSI